MKYEEKESLENVCCFFCKKILVLVTEDMAFLLHFPIDSFNGTQDLTINPEDATIIKRSSEAPKLMGAHIQKHLDICKMEKEHK